MADFPALPLWTDAYLADTRHLTTLEHGAYLLLLMEAWRRPTCSLPDDDRLLARLAGLAMDDWLAIKATVMEFWKRDGRTKTFAQKRLSAEAVYVRGKSKVQREKAAKRWGKKPVDVDANSVENRSSANDMLDPDEGATFSDAPASDGNPTINEYATALPMQCPGDAPTPTPTPTPIKSYDDVDDSAGVRGRDVAQSGGPTADHELAIDACRAAGVRHADPGSIARNVTLVREWQQAGADPPLILTTIREDRAAPDAPNITSLKYFDTAVRRAAAQREARSNGHEVRQHGPNRARPAGRTGIVLDMLARSREAASQAGDNGIAGGAGNAVSKIQ
ncbi:DUF1376 domain-containing protein [Sandarakinorhabdus sp. DWP1-3-1]|uniref:DUF1376 domain-containing protein n=1 Tax=Sandarakinorhabdus sp. DWP1-3-1 TaxID=2804627 RepID=UPI003CF62839